MLPQVEFTGHIAGKMYKNRGRLCLGTDVADPVWRQRRIESRRLGGEYTGFNVENRIRIGQSRGFQQNGSTRSF